MSSFGEDLRVRWIEMQKDGIRLNFVGKISYSLALEETHLLHALKSKYDGKLNSVNMKGCINILPS